MSTCCEYHVSMGSSPESRNRSNIQRSIKWRTNTSLSGELKALGIPMFIQWADHISRNDIYGIKARAHSRLAIWCNMSLGSFGRAIHLVFILVDALHENYIVRYCMCSCYIYLPQICRESSLLSDTTKNIKTLRWPICFVSVYQFSILKGLDRR